MIRERALKVVLVLVGLVFSAGIYPLVTSLRDGWQANKEDALPMMLSLCVTLGVFLLVAARNPSENRSVIAFAAWSSFAHGAGETSQLSPPTSTERDCVASFEPSKLTSTG
jgi:hypothetical protein